MSPLRRSAPASWDIHRGIVVKVVAGEHGVAHVRYMLVEAIR